MTVLRLFFFAALLGVNGPAFTADYVPRDTQAPGESPPSPAEAAKAITLPEGFHATLFAGEPDVRQPVAMALDARGRLWVAESYSYKEWEHRAEDRILVFEDTDNDGRHDKRTVFWTGGNHVSGMTVGWGGVWICDSPNLLFIPDRDGDDQPDGAPEVVLDGWTEKAGHNFFNGLTWGIDGWLYGRHGITAPSTVGRPGSPEAERLTFDCAIWRYHPVSHRFEVVCRGTTNPWGLDWNSLGDLFFTNNVNGHLWHVLPGAFYPRMGDRADPVIQGVYERIPLTADHLHHAGTTADWTKTRDGVGIHGDLGGGHSHCGGMIYLGGKWPEAYADTVFLCNTHGRRLNNDRLETRGSGYVAKHGKDFMFANNPWFRGVTLLYGPDGDVFVSDWCDLGECHDNDGVHRSSGRIYKLIYGESGKQSPGFDLGKAPLDDLVNLQLDANEWKARMARHVLQYRFSGEGPPPSAADSARTGEMLTKILDTHPSLAFRIRALLTLSATGLLQPAALASLRESKDDSLRAWAVRLALDGLGAPATAAEGKAGWWAEMAKRDPSPKVRAYLASATQQLPDETAWPVAEALSVHAGDAEDQNLPYLVWFGLRDRVLADPARGLTLMKTSVFPRYAPSIARRLGEAGTPEQIGLLLTTLTGMATGNDAARLQSAAEGLALGLQGRQIEAPAAWNALDAALAQSDSLRSSRARLGLSFDPAATTTRLLETAGDSQANADWRQECVGLLAGTRDAFVVPILIRLLDDEAVRGTAIQALGSFPSSKTAAALTGHFTAMKPAEQTAAVNALSANVAGATALLDAVEAGTLPRHALTAFHARQIQNLKNEGLKKRVESLYGKLQKSSAEKAASIKAWQDQLTADVLAKADVEAGHTLFRATCTACHTFKGEGGNIGPDLTGANRSDVYYLLENIIDPSATLPKDFQVTIIETKAGQSVQGFVAAENDYTVTLRSPAGDASIDKKEITKRTTLEQSLMPEGLLSILKPDQVRDLIGFLQVP